MKTQNQIISSDIWGLGQDAINLNDELIEAGGELTPEIEEHLMAFNTSVESLVDVIGVTCRKMTADCDAIDAEIKRLQDLKTRRKKAQESLKDKLFHFMQDNGIERVEIGTTTARIMKGRAKVVCSEDLELEPYESAISRAKESLPPYISMKVGVSKTELKKWIEAGKPTVSAEIVKEDTLNIK